MQGFSDVRFYPGLDKHLLRDYLTDLKFGLEFLLRNSTLKAPILVKNISRYQDGIIVCFEAKGDAEVQESYRFRVSRRSNKIIPYYSLLPPGWDGLTQPEVSAWPEAQAA